MQEHLALNLEEVDRAIADYLATTAEIDISLRQQDKVWARERAGAEARPIPVRERLRKLRREAAPALQRAGSASCAVGDGASAGR